VIKTIEVKVAIIGGGISACSLSYSLSQHKISHCILESENALALKASGNPVGIFMPVLTAQKTPISEYSFAAYQYFQDLIPALGKAVCQTGVVQMAYNPQKLNRFQKAIEAEVFPKSSFQYCDSDEATSIAGIPIATYSLYFPGAGYLFPRKVCEILAANASLIRTNFSAKRVERHGNKTVIFDEGGTEFVECEIVIFAIGAASDHLRFASSLPFKRIRGQILKIKKLDFFSQMKLPICFDGYLTPPIQNDWQLIGGTYDRKNIDEAIREEDTNELVKRIPQSFPQFNEKLFVQSERASLRSTSPDHLPTFHQLDDHSYFLGHMGSRGFTYAPLAADLTVKKILGLQPSAQDQRIMNLISGKRFYKSNPIRVE